MQRTRIKICGIGSVNDALVAARAGADAIGLVFHPPVKRNVSIERAREILAELPPFVTPVGLFVNAAPEVVIEIASQLGLRHVQLHGDETPATVARLEPMSVIKAIRAERDGLAESLKSWREAIRSMSLRHLRGFVLETPGTAAPGGTGVSNDWNTVREEQQRGGFEGLPHLVAAGGLTPENVADVVRGIRPWAVDVSSGVEASPGVKSEEKIRAFVRAVREAESQF